MITSNKLLSILMQKLKLNTRIPSFLSNTMDDVLRRQKGSNYNQIIPIQLAITPVQLRL
ncbi:hypothetical protein [Polaribacter atrinae]|uniref:hypothetical protein n=1 Tax=Polaribacter atrinae TaxID=1333662 RepID=UPI002490B034|nr:hypothetical protein [Polaribacter atrinae]